MHSTDEPALTARHVNLILRKCYRVIPETVVALPRGYSNVWRVVSLTGNTYVFSVFRANKTVADVESELHILDKLRTLDTGGIAVPRPVRRPHMATRASYVKIRGRFACLYTWIPHTSYDGSLTQAISAVSGYRRVQSALLSIPRPTTLRELAILRGAICTTAWDFRRFIPLIENERWATLYVDTIPACESGVAWIRTVEHQLRHSTYSGPASVIHYDPSPGNFGFSREGDATCLLDFDQVKWGLPAYDLAWNLWSFAAWPHNDSTHQYVSETCGRLRALTHAAAPKLGSLQPTTLRFYLLTRVLLTLHGRLTDTFVNRFANLRFIEAKLSAVKTLVEHAGSVEAAFDNRRSRGS